MDGGSGDASVVSACFGEDGGCNSMALCGPENFVTEVASAAPTATGGTIVPGVYSMTSYTIYTGASGTSGKLTNWFQETFQLIAPTSSDAGTDAGTDAATDGESPEDGGSATGTTSQSFTWLDVTETDQGGPAAHGSGLAVQQLTTLSLNHECPTASSFPTTYTATPTSITIYFDDTGIGTAENVFQRVQ